MGDLVCLLITDGLNGLVGLVFIVGFILLYIVCLRWILDVVVFYCAVLLVYFCVEFALLLFVVLVGVWLLFMLLCNCLIVLRFTMWL